MQSVLARWAQLLEKNFNDCRIIFERRIVVIEHQIIDAATQKGKRTAQRVVSICDALCLLKCAWRGFGAELLSGGLSRAHPHSAVWEPPGAVSEASALFVSVLSASGGGNSTNHTRITTKLRAVAMIRFLF